MREIDVQGDPVLPALTGMIRNLSLEESSEGTLGRFFVEFGRLRRMDWFVGVLPEGDGYRVHYHISPTDREGSWYQRDVREEAIRALPLRRTGFLREMTRGSGPRLVIDLAHGVGDLADGPALPTDVAACDTCLVLPIFSREGVQEWSLCFSRLGESLTLRDVSQAVMTANLLGIANRAQDLAMEVRRLNGALSEQVRQIASLQRSLLPRRMPTPKGWTIATHYATSEESGGDYFDFFELSGGRLGALIADVSGHGAAAATVMAMLHAIVHCYQPGGAGGGATRGPGGVNQFEPGAVLEFANDRLFAAGLEASFVTAFLGVLEPTTGRLVYANAGHHPPRRRTVEGGVARVEGIEGAATVPLAVLPELGATQRTCVVGPGEAVVLFTDGIVESFGSDGEQFGQERLDGAIAGGPGASGHPEAIVARVLAALREHRGAETRDDDQTLVVLGRER